MIGGTEVDRHLWEMTSKWLNSNIHLVHHHHHLDSTNNLMLLVKRENFRKTIMIIVFIFTNIIHFIIEKKMFHMFKQCSCFSFFLLQISLNTGVWYGCLEIFCIRELILMLAGILDTTGTYSKGTFLRSFNCEKE